MKTEIFSAELLKTLLKIKKTCTLDEMMRELGTSARKTVFRKLAELEYQTSYSHHGKYYALKQICKFNEGGLWTHKEAWFSMYGSLLETAKEFVEKSSSGCSVDELSELLHVSSKQALLTLAQRELLVRRKFSGVFIYFSTNDEVRKHQAQARQSECYGKPSVIGQEVLAHELKAAIILFFSVLDERQRRLYAGIESLKFGHGGDAPIAELLGIDPHTVAKGRKELLKRDIDFARLRQPGGGRKRQEKKPQK